MSSDVPLVPPAATAAKLAADAAVAPAQNVLALSRSITIDSHARADFVGQVLRQVKTEAAVLEAAKKQFVAPAQAFIKSVNAFYKPAVDAYAAAEAALKGAIAAYQARTLAAQEAAMLAAAPAPPPVEIEGVSSRRITEIVIVDPDLVPRHLCVPDMGKIKMYIDAGAEVPPGVEIQTRIILAARKA